VGGGDDINSEEKSASPPSHKLDVFINRPLHEVIMKIPNLTELPTIPIIQSQSVELKNCKFETDDDHQAARDLLRFLMVNDKYNDNVTPN